MTTSSPNVTAAMSLDIPSSGIATAAGSTTWLVFQLADQHYAASLDQVSEVLRDGEITPVPGAADELLGIFHLRGQIVPVMDGRRRLGLAGEPAADPAGVRIVVLVCEGYSVGLRVDGVGELLTPDIEAVEAAGNHERRGDDPVKGVLPWQQGFVALLDVGRLVGRRGD